jgi:hypothetical protein
MVAGVVGDVNPVFHHGRHGAGVHAVGLHARTVHLRARAKEMFEVAVRHLAAAAVACAEHQNVFHRVSFFKKIDFQLNDKAF